MNKKQPDSRERWLTARGTAFATPPIPVAFPNEADGIHSARESQCNRKTFHSDLLRRILQNTENRPFFPESQPRKASCQRYGTRWLLHFVFLSRRAFRIRRLPDGFSSVIFSVSEKKRCNILNGGRQGGYLVPFKKTFSIRCSLRKSYLAAGKGIRQSRIPGNLRMHVFCIRLQTAEKMTK